MQKAKYEKGYFMPEKVTYDWVKKDAIEQAPRWCSVDLRDGNQALVEPMGLEEKLIFFKMLVDIGFKEIEVGFPAASETEFQFLRTLIDENMIPKDVTIQVLTQAREHIIKRTFEAIEGAPHVVVHLYNSVSVEQREQVFQKTKEEVKLIAVEGAKLLKVLAKETKGNFTFQYSPESFPGAEVEYALEICNAVLDIWKPTVDCPAIINIPTTVEKAMPHVFATQVEYIHKRLKYRERVILSIHPHNDRGSGISDAELGILAGADRVEGTLFGNGERTGNVDLITLAMNLLSHGVDPKLDFTNMVHICEVYEKFTKMTVHDRHPYAGALVFTAFSGSHQDAIAKGMEWRKSHEDEPWRVPYLPIDPKDVGRTYESDVIRINSQSGKGGVNYILQQNYGIQLPEQMKEEVGYLAKGVSDKAHKELTPEWIYQIFNDHYVFPIKAFSILDFDFTIQKDIITAEVTIEHNLERMHIAGSGNGRLDAVSNAIRQYFQLEYDLICYKEHSLSTGTASKAVSYVGVKSGEKTYWGVGIDADIIKSSIEALIVAVNKVTDDEDDSIKKESRLTEIVNYIQGNYATVTLDDLSSAFFLTKPYLSKYIKEKSGKTFVEILKEIRLKKARYLLKESNISVERISQNIGYQNVEHFNRLFKKKYKITPLQFRNEE